MIKLLILDREAKFPSHVLTLTDASINKTSYWNKTRSQRVKKLTPSSSDSFVDPWSSACVFFKIRNESVVIVNLN